MPGRGERVRRRREEGPKAVVEVGEEQDLAVWEDLEQRGLVHALNEHGFTSQMLQGTGV